MLNELAQTIHQGVKEKGFWDAERNVGELLMLVTSELGEAMEAHRKGRICTDGPGVIGHVIKENDEWFKEFFEKLVKDTFEDEIADAIIRLLDMAAGLNIDIDAHISAKLRYNASRPRLHGKRY